MALSRQVNDKAQALHQYLKSLFNHSRYKTKINKKSLNSLIASETSLS